MMPASVKVKLEAADPLLYK